MISAVYGAEATNVQQHLQKLRRGHPRDSYDCLGGLSVELFRGAMMFKVEDANDGPVGFTTVHIGRRKKNVWEPYANWTLAYIAPTHRRRGLGRELAVHTLAYARFLGCARVKSKVGSYLGLRLHLSLGHDIWGELPTPERELQVDSPLLPRDRFPNGRTPMGARGIRNSTRTSPLSREEIATECKWRGWDYEFLCVPS